MNDIAPEDFLSSLAAQRQRLLHHAGEVLLSGREATPAPDALDRLSQAFLTSIELIKAAESEIGESRRLAEQVRSERSRFRELFDRAPSALLLTARDTTIRLANHAAGALLGRSPSQLEGRELAGMMDPSQQRGLREYVDHVVTSGGAATWSFSIQAVDRGPVLVKAAVSLIDDTGFPGRSLYWAIATA